MRHTLLWLTLMIKIEIIDNYKNVKNRACQYIRAEI